MRPVTRRTCLWLLLSAVAAAVLPPTSHASLTDRAATPVVELGKNTVVTATHHSRALLTVPEDVSLGELKSSVAGGGRIAGYVLTNSGQEPQDDDFIVYSLTFNRCTKRGCPPAADPLPTRVSSGLTNNVIPAGTYNLFVIADHAPVVVRFTNRYLSGSDDVRLRGKSFDVDLRTLRTHVSTTDGTVFSAGDFTRLEPGRGMGMLGLWARGAPYAAAAFGNCFYFSDVLVVRRDVAFLPGCPTGSSAHRYPGVSSQPMAQGGVIYKSTYQELPMGIGGWAASAGVVNDFGAVALWLRF